jgi:hypothetical protein
MMREETPTRSNLRWTFLGEGVYPSVVRERVHKRMNLKEINDVPLEHDGE